MTRLVVLVLGHASHPHHLNEVTQKETWGREASEEVKVFWLHDDLSGNRVRELPGRRLSVPLTMGETANVPYGAPIEKSARAVGWALNRFSPDYILRTNASTFIDTSRLLDTLDALPREDLYMGCLGNASRGQRDQVTFVSGSGALLSADVAERLSSAKGSGERGLLEDVAIGSYLERAGIVPTGGTRVDVSTGEPLSAHWLVRLKSYVFDGLTRQRMVETHSVFGEPDPVRRREMMRAIDAREPSRRLLERASMLTSEPTRAHLMALAGSLPEFVRSSRLRRATITQRCESFEQGR